MHIRTFILILLSGIIITGCKQKQINPEEKITQCIKFDSHIKTESIYNADSSLFTPQKFIVLEDQKYIFGRIDQIKIANNNIYILDEKRKILLAYDIEGNQIGKVGQFGSGPNEYLDIASFDIDSSGNIYTIDGRLDKLFIYDKELNFISSQKIPFEVDQIQILDNGHFMFALSSWNHELYANTKILITDRDLNKIKSYFEYDEYIDDNYWISGYQFIKSKDYIIYNKPIDNNIYIFTRNGDLSKIITFDFGSENVPDDKKREIEKNLIYYNEYCLLKNFTIITDKFIAGTIWDKTNTKTYIINNYTGKTYIGEKTDDSDNSSLAGFSDTMIISYIHPDFYTESPDFKYANNEIKEQVQQGKFVLCIRNTK